MLLWIYSIVFELPRGFLSIRVARRLSPGPSLRLAYLPPSTTLTLNLQTHPNWILEAVLAREDLDNIRFDPRATRATTVSAVFDLVSIVATGPHRAAAFYAPPPPSPPMPALSRSLSAAARNVRSR